MRRRAALVGLTVAALLVGPTAYAQAAPGYRPGAASIGDPYFPLAGNGGYDVGHYDLALRYDPGTDVLTGRATITATATQNLSRFDLDLDELDVSAVTVDGIPASFGHNVGELRVTPRAGLPSGVQFRVVVAYSGVPGLQHDGSGFIATDDGAMIIGEPGVAASWFPANDHPADKASYRFAVTVPTGLSVAANGVPVGEVARGAWTTFTWEQAEPMASYLATASIGKWTRTSRLADGVPVLDFVDPDLLGTPLGDRIEAALSREPAILRFLSSVYGPYPFASAGGIVDDDTSVGFALENQTRPIYPSSTFAYGPDYGLSTVVHELAHQWYGDSVSLGLWSDIWLNEGFATYAEWLWSEHQGGDSAQQIFDSFYARPVWSPFWKLRIGDPGAGKLFASAVYYRGAMTLQALRVEIGDDVFFRVLPAWASVGEGRSLVTADFIALAEQLSGRDLDAFFDAWLYTAAKPPLEV